MYAIFNVVFLFSFIIWKKWLKELKSQEFIFLAFNFMLSVALYWGRNQTNGAL